MKEIGRSKAIPAIITNIPFQQGGKCHLFLRSQKKNLLGREESTETKQIEFENDIIGGCITYNVRSVPLACCINFISASLHNDSDLSPVQSKE